MTYRGFDAAFDVTRLIPKMRAAKIDFVGRYYSHNVAKNLSAAEARALTQAGIAIVSVWEARGDQVSGFSAAMGASDAAAALAQARVCQQTFGTPIYFAVDFDASPDEIVAFVKPYFMSANQGLAGQYRVGAYGSGLVLQTLLAAGLIEAQWQACAGGWRGTHGHQGADIMQGLPGDPYGFGQEVDPDTAYTDSYGGWLVGGSVITAPLPPAQGGQTAPAPSIPDAIKVLQAALGVAPDGVWGRLSQAALDAWRAGA